MEKNNKLIAEFMGLDTEVFKSGKVNYYYDDKVSKQEIFLEAHELSYNVSWDWLMPVVEKINLQVTLGHATGGIHKVIDKIHHRVKHTMIDATYQAVVEFIKEYNQND